MKERQTKDKKGQKEVGSGVKWLGQTVGFSILPVVLLILGHMYTNEIPLDFFDSIRNFLLLVATVAYGLILFLDEKKKNINKLFYGFVQKGAVALCYIGLLYYIAFAGRENDNVFQVVLIICVGCIIVCSILGVIAGHISDKTEIKEEAARKEMEEQCKRKARQRCRELFAVTANEEQKKILDNISEEKFYCEDLDINLVESLEKCRSWKEMRN